MTFSRCAALVCALLALSVPIGAQDKNILSLASDLGAVLEWDPLRDAGVISFGDDRISIAVGTDSALINYRLKVQIDAPARRGGGVWLTTAAVGAIGDAVQKDRLAHAGEHLRVQYILLDPGHGGKDSGAVGSVASGKKQVPLMEKDITLTVGRALAGLLREGFPDKEVMLTRTDDTFVSLEDRVVIANGLLEKTKDTVLYVSIHANTSPFNKTASGFEVWCLPPSYERTLVDEKAAGKENHGHPAHPQQHAGRGGLPGEHDAGAEHPGRARREHRAEERQPGAAPERLVRRAQRPDACRAHRGGFREQRGRGASPCRPGVLERRGAGHVQWTHKHSSRDSNGAEASVLDRLDFLLASASAWHNRRSSAPLSSALSPCLSCCSSLSETRGSARILFFPSQPTGPARRGDAARSTPSDARRERAARRRTMSCSGPPVTMRCGSSPAGRR